MGNDMYEQEDELKKDKETAKTGCLMTGTEDLEINYINVIDE